MTVSLDSGARALQLLAVCSVAASGRSSLAMRLAGRRTRLQKMSPAILVARTGETAVPMQADMRLMLKIYLRACLRGPWHGHGAG